VVTKPTVQLDVIAAGIVEKPLNAINFLALGASDKDVSGYTEFFDVD